MAKESIGIIGGAGVAATNTLLAIIENTLTLEGACRDNDHPEMYIVQATKVPSRSMFLEGRGESFIPEYITIASKLKNMGATKICMCCNTAHYAIEELQKHSDISFINMIEAVCVEADKQKKKNIALVASDGCLEGRVYERCIEKLKLDISIIYPDKELQREVTKGICNSKNKYRFDPIDSIHRPKNIFNKICDELFARGADSIILGCTDIRVDFSRENTIDSLEVLAKKIIEEAGRDEQ